MQLESVASARNISLMSYTIEQIEGIGPANATKLAAAEIKTTDDLLDKCGAADGRKAVSEATSIGAPTLLKWANMADLMRIKGVGEEYSELLHEAGVDTVKELKHRNSENLATKMAEVNETKNLTRKLPAATVVAGWIDQAKSMDARITH